MANTIEDTVDEIRSILNYLDDDLRTYNRYPKFRKELIEDIMRDADRIRNLCMRLKEKTLEYKD